jgi:hypothetical protein
VPSSRSRPGSGRCLALREFDALTGKGINPGHCQLTVMQARVADGNIEVLVELS